MTLFFFTIPLSFFHKIRYWSNKYCYEDWVEAKIGLDRDGKPKKRRYLKHVPTELVAGRRTKKRRRKRRTPPQNKRQRCGEKQPEDQREKEDEPPELLHRGDKEKKKFKITTGFVICWIGYFIYLGALFGSNKPGGDVLYAGGAYGINIPLLRNVMVRDAYAFMRRFIHFCDNNKRKDKNP